MHCHLHEVVHRDIKPDNIILRNGEWEDAVLVDFGMSHCHQDDKEFKSLNQVISNYAK